LQSVNPKEDICCERMDELLGPVWREVLGSTTSSCKVNKAKKEMRKILADKLKDSLQRINIAPKCPSTLIYIFAATLLPSTPVIVRLGHSSNSKQRKTRVSQQGTGSSIRRRSV